MTPSNTKILDYFLMPTASLPPRKGDRLRISERHFGEFHCDDLNGVLKAIAEWIGTGRTKAELN